MAAIFRPLEGDVMRKSRRDFLRISAAASGALGLGRAAPLLGLAETRSLSSASPEGSPGASPPAPLRILILGGTGFIGPHQVRYALERGHTLTLFNRGRTNPGMFSNVETLIGDRDGQLDALRGREWDVVIDNSGFYPRHVRDSAELLVDSVGTYMFVSSISAYDTTLKPGQDEYEAPIATMADPTDESESPYGPSYGARKALCEQVVLEVFGEERTNVVRPGLITGPGDPTDRIRHWIARVERGGEILAPGKPTDPVQLIDARDLTDWMVRMLEQGDVGLYNGVGPESPLSIAEMVYGIRAVSNSVVSFTWVSSEFLAEHEVPGFRYQPWIASDSPFAGFNYVTHARSLATGLTFRPLATTAVDMLEEYLEAPQADRDEGLGRRGGVSWEQEAELLEAWHAREG